MRLFLPTIALSLSISIAGCTAMQKPWGRGAVVGAGLGALVAGGALGAAANDGAFDEPDDSTHSSAIAIGVVGGGIVGAVLGHIFLDDEPFVPPVRVAATPPPAPKPLVVLTGANFAFDSAALTSDGMDALTPTLSALKANTTLRVSVVGHTDSRGPEEYNQRLSQQRADTVKRHLVDHGIAGDRIKTSGLGESKPVADNETTAGRTTNRRVEVLRLP